MYVVGMFRIDLDASVDTLEQAGWLVKR